MPSSKLPNYCCLSTSWKEPQTLADGAHTHTRIHKDVLFKTITRASADSGVEMQFSWENNRFRFFTVFAWSRCCKVDRDHGKKKKTPPEVSSHIGQRRKTTIPISHSCPVECRDCSSDCRISINLEMQLDTGASDREGETLSRSITSRACHSYKRPD